MKQGYSMTQLKNNLLRIALASAVGVVLGVCPQVSHAQEKALPQLNTAAPTPPPVMAAPKPLEVKKPEDVVKAMESKAIANKPAPVVEQKHQAPPIEIPKEGAPKKLEKTASPSLPVANTSLTAPTPVVVPPVAVQPAGSVTINPEAQVIVPAPNSATK